MIPLSLSRFEVNARPRHIPFVKFNTFYDPSWQNTSHVTVCQLLKSFTIIYANATSTFLICIKIQYFSFSYTFFVYLCTLFFYHHLNAISMQLHSICSNYTSFVFYSFIFVFLYFYVQISGLRSPMYHGITANGMNCNMQGINVLFSSLLYLTQPY